MQLDPPFAQSWLTLETRREDDDLVAMEAQSHNHYYHLSHTIAPWCHFTTIDNMIGNEEGTKSSEGGDP